MKLLNIVHEEVLNLKQFHSLAGIKDEIANQVAAKLSANEPTFINAGTMARVYHIGNNRVLKLTDDASDAVVFSKIKNKASRALPKVYDVFKVFYRVPGYTITNTTYGIVVEHLKQDCQLIEKYLHEIIWVMEGDMAFEKLMVGEKMVRILQNKDFYSWFKNNVSKIIAKNPESILRTDKGKPHISYRRDAIHIKPTEINVEALLKFLWDIGESLRELTMAGVKDFWDIKAANIGVNSEDNYIMLDLGANTCLFETASISEL